MSGIMLDGEETVAMPESFLVVMCVKGEAVITDNNGAVTRIHQGETVLVPASLTTLRLQGHAMLITASV